MKFWLIQNPKDSTKIAVGGTDGLKEIIKLKHCNPNHSIIIAVSKSYGT